MSGGKQFHEIRDPVHTFVRLDSAERAVVDSEPYQRLRNIHQLAMTYLVYPGACHTGFEHCLGVMELSTRIYDVVTAPGNLHPEVPRDMVPVAASLDFAYWRQAVRMAALCHDLGHLPFSHAAEDILPEGHSHEDISLAIIRSDAMKPLWERLHLSAEHVGKLAVGAKHYKDSPLSDWEALLSEIITGDAFGADRMDYLLRDSLHAGVSYGHFEHHRLIDSLRILPIAQEDSVVPILGVDQGGLQSAESLVWARYFMYTQLYFHHVRRVYDFHLKQFLGEWLDGGRFSAEFQEHQKLTDVEVIAAMRAASVTPEAKGHYAARRIIKRQHFRMVSEVTEADRTLEKNFAKLLEQRLREMLGDGVVYLDQYSQKAKGIRFPVLTRDGGIEWSISLSATLSQIPTFQVQYVFVAPEQASLARKAVASFREELRAQKETSNDQR